jgi:CheY-like chemotaxis protein
VVGNASELREALTNLVFNATDAMPRGGSLTLRTSARAPRGDGVAEGAREVVMEVCDTGIGMDAETRQKCLEPFYTTKGDHGTGLGLAMVYGVVQRHNCQLEIESELRKGTTMRVIFPPGEGDFSEDPALSPTAVEVSPMRILYIDDEPLLRDLMKSMLGSHGHRVQVADDGESGLGAFRNARDRSEPFDVVITDLGVPYMDGRQVAHVLKTESPSTPVIMMTGWGSMLEENEEPLYVDSVISKPPQMMEISRALYELQTKREEQPVQRLAVSP